MTRHVVAPALEALERRELFNAVPDLQVTILDVVGPDILVPGDKGTVKVQIQNVGTAAAVGTVDATVRASLDTAFDVTDPVMGGLTGKKINLAIGASLVLSIPGVVPDTATPEDYSLLVHATSTLSVPDGAAGNDTAATAGTKQVVWQFGAVGTRTNVRLTLHDGATPVVFALTGPGTGTVDLGGGGFATNYVVILGSTIASALTITTPKGAVATMAYLHVRNTASIGTGAIKSITAPGLDLETGLSVDDMISSLTVHDIHSITHYLTLNATSRPVGARDSVTISAHTISGCTVTTNGLPIKSFTAAQITGLDLTAPWIGKMTITSKVPGEGNLSGTMDLTGTAPKDVNLGSLTVSGALDATIGLEGSAGPIKAASWLTGGIDASEVKSITIAGDMSVDIGLPTLFAVTVGGDLSGQWSTGWLGKVTVNGDMNNMTMLLGSQIPGGAGLTWNQLESLTVKGWINSSTISCMNPIGSITAGGIQDSTIKTGLLGTDLPTQASDFESHHSGTIKTLTVKGLKDGAGDPIESFINSVIAAWRFDTVSFAYADTTNAAPFGFAAHSIGKLTYKHFPGGGPSTTSFGPMTLASDSVTIDDMEIRILV
ncbi:MAG: hypothetical protein NTV86_10660 [Planctomycetota bacterium]|nr:hypothetical protein [Planctomycetota bacterium]